MIIRIRVKPGASRDFVSKAGEGYLVEVREFARDGKANAKVVRLLAKKFGVSTKDIKIKTLKGRKKIVEIL